MFFVGKQLNGGRFTDLRGETLWDQPGDTGMIDWGSFTPRALALATNDSSGSSGGGGGGGHAVLKGLDALVGGQGRGMSMARTLGSDPNQVAVAGRRVIVGWTSGLWHLQSLPQDLSVGADDQLLQAFVPELQSLRVGPSVKIEPITTQPFGQQLEIFASFSPPAQGSGVQGGGGGKTEVVVLRSESGAEGTMVGVDFESELVYIDGRKQGNSVVRAGPLLGLETNGGGKGGVSGSGSVVTVHIIVDHSVVVAIFNNRTAITVAVKPSSADACGASYAGQVDAEAWVLATANPNDGPQRTPLPAWQVPKIHNAPPCNRYT